ncbi:deubiquitinating protein VCPIP1-like isoform X2 [Lycorma delicatula]|uniref:deubiquitinating protein VCPIP1-like isoform X2 n=1 Tax=Lycorma delicatula TaxID=130591 RepID=UPI003F50FCD1
MSSSCYLKKFYTELQEIVLLKIMENLATEMQRGVCPDEECCCPIVYSFSEIRVTCRYCGQTHDINKIQHSVPLDSIPLAIQTLFKTLLLNEHIIPKKGPDMVKVLGLSNYHHKLISPLLTHYGVDKRTGQARPLSELTGRATLDCSVLGDRSFRVESRHLDISGYGLDQTGSLSYLADTLDLLKHFNNNIDVLVPLHADGDGHCLVHAVSRALVGRELFWHPLRSALKQHLIKHIDEYTALLGDFINGSEWPGIIAECDPDYVPVDEDILGLRNVHIFGLANLLRRPILLLDNLSGMNTSADYSAMFLPGLSPPEMCGKNGRLNPPICVAWSSAARNHFIPLVPVKDRPLPKFPRHLLPKVWGFPQPLLDKYIMFDEQNCLTIGGETGLTDSYILKLTASIDQLFMQKFGAPPRLVADVYHYNYRLKSGIKPSVVTEVTHCALQDRRLQRCLTCDAINILPLSGDWLRPKGLLYNLAKKEYGFLQENKLYPFHSYGVTCSYNARKDMLVLESAIQMEVCMFCQGSKLRTILSDGSVAYENGDITTIPVSSPNTNICPCGFKHYWKGQLYDNPPQNIPVVLSWNGRTVSDTVQWFQFESQSQLNSNVYHVATVLLQKHFPGEFGSETLHNSIVSQILERTKDFPSPTSAQLAEKEEASGGDNAINNDLLGGISNGKVGNNSSSTGQIWPLQNYRGGEPSCSGPIPTMRQSKKILPQGGDPINKSSSKKMMSLSSYPSSSASYASSSAGSPFSGNLKSCSRSKLGPGYTMLTDKPATENNEKMAKFFQVLYKNDSAPSLSSASLSQSSDSTIKSSSTSTAPSSESPGSPGPSTSKENV